MLHAARKYQKRAIYVLVAILILGVGFSTFAQFADNAYVVRTVHIFPSEVSSSGWQNAATLNFQNLDEYALLQDFNDINSATLGKSAESTPAAEINTTPAPDATTGATTSTEDEESDTTQPAAETAPSTSAPTTATNQPVEVDTETAADSSAQPSPATNTDPVQEQGAPAEPQLDLPEQESATDEQTTG